jgi:3-oxoacid CoA-transferase subunit A
LLEQGTTDLETVSNNCGIDGAGLGLLLAAGRIRRTTGSYEGENREFARQYLGGELELELCPQGTLAERLRAGGSGIPAFYTPAGVGTLVAEGGLPWRYAADGSVAVASPPKEVREFDGSTYVLERGIVTDFALVRAARGDRHGNLCYDASARNFNPLCAMAGRITVAEVEQLVEPGELDPEQVHTPGVFVQRVVEVGTAGKKIEKLTTRPRPAVAS